MIDSFTERLAKPDIKNSNLSDLIKEIEKIAQDIHNNNTRGNPPQGEAGD